MERLYSVEDVAVLLGVKKGTVHKYVSEGRLKVTAFIRDEDEGHYRCYFNDNTIEEFMGGDEGYNRYMQKKILEAEIEERLNRLLYLEQQERWDDQFERDFLKKMGLA